jgi:hypothetical protein
MTPAEYTAYKERFAKAVQKSKDALEAQALKGVRARRSAKSGEGPRRSGRATKLDPVHNAYEALRTGKRLDGEIPEEIKGKKLSREAVREFPGYKGTRRSGLRSRRRNGLDPEVAAPYYGFKNGHGDAR